MSFERTIAYPKETCPICTDFLTEDVWNHDKKQHNFHGRCIAKWVNITSDCPMCRKPVDKASLLGYEMLLAEEEDDDEDGFLYGLPKEWTEAYVFILISGASLPIYDLICHGNPAIIGAIASLGVCLIVRKIVEV